MNKTITIEKIINAPIDRVFKAFITPEDIMKWFYTSDGWTTPHAVVDATVDGKFNIGFQDPDGNHAFDFTGTYTEVTRPYKISYTIEDGRKVFIDFIKVSDNETKIIQEFEMETVNSEALQRNGWSAQLDHLEDLLNLE